MRRVFIVGFGKFGRAAWNRLRTRHPKIQAWAVDRRPQAFWGSEGDGDRLCRVIADGPGFLFTFRHDLRDDDWIIPALPVHLAGEWLVRVFGPSFKPAPLPDIGKGFPFRKILGHGLYLSYADFLCPEDCPAPAGYCYRTGKKRPQPLWQYLQDQRVQGRTVAVVVSRQLAPGVGGYPFSELKGLESSVEKGRFPFYLATACRCHGVVHGFQSDRS
jgi:hypothetical protein